MRNQSVSKTVILIAFLISVLLGIFLGDLAGISLVIYLGITIPIIVLSIVFWKKSEWKLILFILLGLISGFSYTDLWNQKNESISLVSSEEELIHGQVINYPVFEGSKAEYILKYRGFKIKVTAGRYPEFKYGDVLEFKGTIKKPTDYNFHKNILGEVWAESDIKKVGYKGNSFFKTLFFAREKFEKILTKILPEPYASFASGITIGSKSSIPDSLMSDFNRTGTTHLVAVSGYNVTIVIMYIAVLLGLISRKFKFWGSLFVILSFVMLTGGQASVLRAGILAALVLFGRYEGRRINMTILLPFTAVIMLLFNPYGLKYDISFQLSFLAFAGIIYLTPIILSLRIIKILPDIIKKPLAETLGAQVMVLPIIIYYFGQISLVSTIVNVLVLSVIPLAMGLVFLVGIIGLFYIPLGKIVGFVLYIVLKYIIIVVENFSKLSFASYFFKINSWWWLPIVYLVLLLVIVKLRKINEKESSLTIYS